MIYSGVFLTKLKVFSYSMGSVELFVYDPQSCSLFAYVCEVNY